MPPNTIVDWAETFELGTLGQTAVCAVCGAVYAVSWPESHRAVFGHSGRDSGVVRLA